MRGNENDTLPGGIVAIDKPRGCTSHDVINKVRTLYETSRVGHTGTLDPMATGVLVVLVGRAAKACEFVSGGKKRYTATLRLGLETDTEDITGTVLNEYGGRLPEYGEVCGAVRNFRGKIMQTPPMYSALKLGGEKLYDLARRGITVERQSREIEIFSIDCMRTDSPSEYLLDVTCSGGTYIRTLCADIGKSLGCGGVMASLRRIYANGIGIDQAYTLEALSELDPQQRREALFDVQTLFADLPSINLSGFFERLFRSGCPVYQKKLGTDFKCGEMLRICDMSGAFFALGEIGMYEEGSAVKSVKIFRL